MGFLVTVGASLAILAGVTLLPAWQRGQEARLLRDRLAVEVQTQRQLAAFKERLIEAVKRDPRQTAQLLMQQQHYRLPDQVPIPVAAPADLPPAAMLAARADQPRPPDPRLLGLARRLEHDNARHGMLLIAAALMVGALLLFLPPERRKV